MWSNKDPTCTCRVHYLSVSCVAATVWVGLIGSGHSLCLCELCVGGLRERHRDTMLYADVSRHHDYSKWQQTRAVVDGGDL